MNSTAYSNAITANCTTLEAEILTFNTVVLNSILMIASFAYSSSSASQRNQSMLILVATFFCFIAGLTNWLGWVLDDPTSSNAITSLSWITDCIAKLCLFTFSYTRILNLANSSSLLNIYFGAGVTYILAFTTPLVIDSTQPGSSGLLWGDNSTVRHVVLGFYFAYDLTIIPMDLYLAYMVVFVAKSKGKKETIKDIGYYFKLMKGAGFVIFTSICCCVVTCVLRLAGFDTYYTYYQVIYSFRICLIQIFNVKIIDIMATKRQKTAISVQSAVRKVIEFKAKSCPTLGNIVQEILIVPQNDRVSLSSKTVPMWNAPIIDFLEHTIDSNSLPSTQIIGAKISPKISPKLLFELKNPVDDEVPVSIVMHFSGETSSDQILK